MVSPHWAFNFIVHQPYVAFLTMGAVILTMTGVTLYMPIWGIFDVYLFVLLGSLLFYRVYCLTTQDRQHYYASPEAISNPFYVLVPDWGLYPMIGLATAAAVIASQAVITGVFSMTNQAIQLRYYP